MAVKVVHRISSTSTTARNAEHEDGTAFLVHNGHLFVSAQDTKETIAVYSPDCWISAEVTE